jgi:hypothetical protein
MVSDFAICTNDEIARVPLRIYHIPPLTVIIPGAAGD